MIMFESRMVVYSEDRWRTLWKKRELALEIMRCLRKVGINAIVYGSIARGDVTDKSDVDVFIPSKIPSYSVELALEEWGMNIYGRLIVQATPSYAVKAYIFLDVEELVSVSFPLVKMIDKELEFYGFGGSLNFNELLMKKRVPGVSKKLLLIEPIDKGHVESTVLGREDEVAKLLGISPEIVKERVRILTRREEHGRTGVFIKYYLRSEDTFERALKKLMKSNPLLNKLVRERGGV